MPAIIDKAAHLSLFPPAPSPAPPAWTGARLLGATSPCAMVRHPSPTCPSTVQSCLLDELPSPARDNGRPSPASCTPMSESHTPRIRAACHTRLALALALATPRSSPPSMVDEMSVFVEPSPGRRRASLFGLSAARPAAPLVLPEFGQPRIISSWHQSTTHHKQSLVLRLLWSSSDRRLAQVCRPHLSRLMPIMDDGPRVTPEDPQASVPGPHGSGESFHSSFILRLCPDGAPVQPFGCDAPHWSSQRRPGNQPPTRFRPSTTLAGPPPLHPTSQPACCRPSHVSHAPDAAGGMPTAQSDGLNMHRKLREERRNGSLEAGVRRLPGFVTSCRACLPHQVVRSAPIAITRLVAGRRTRQRERLRLDLENGRPRTATAMLRVPSMLRRTANQDCRFYLDTGPWRSVLHVLLPRQVRHVFPANRSLRQDGLPLRHALCSTALSSTG